MSAALGRSILKPYLRPIVDAFQKTLGEGGWSKEWGPGETKHVFGLPLLIDRYSYDGAYNATFIRASGATVIDHEGVTRTLINDEIGFVGARRVQNLMDASGTPAGQTVVLERGTYTLSAYGDGSLVITSPFLETVNGGEAIIFYTEGASLTFTVDNLTQIQLELTTDQSNQSPAVYVDSEVEHGSNVLGVKCFDTENDGTGGYVIIGRKLLSIPLLSTLWGIEGSADATFSRNSGATVEDFEGNIKLIKVGAAGFKGARYVENLFSISGTPATQTVSLTRGDYAYSSYGAIGTVSIEGVGSVPAGEGQFFSLAADATVTFTVNGSVDKFQLENVTGQTNSAPAEYVDSDTDYGAGVAGVKYFETNNAGAWQ